MKRKHLFLIVGLVGFSFCAESQADSADSNDSGDLGVAYAFLNLMTLSTDFASANYKIDSTTFQIHRLPVNFEIQKTNTGSLTLELALAWQETRDTLYLFSDSSEYLDAYWHTYGASVGLMVKRSITEHLKFTPSMRLGVTHMTNDVDYYGERMLELEPVLNELFFNWNTNVSVLNLGAGFLYDWYFKNRQNKITGNLYHIIINSFNESKSAAKFSESANMLSLKADIILPSDRYIMSNRIDMVLLLGSTSFLGENRNALGYTSSLQIGLGLEFPVIWSSNQIGHLRLGGSVLRASNMRGWFLTIGYNPE